jgi:hypothetical protein
MITPGNVHVVNDPAFAIVLRARLVKPQIQGRQTFYSLDRRGLDEARTYLEGLEDVAERYGNRPPGAQTGKH